MLKNNNILLVDAIPLFLQSLANQDKSHYTISGYGAILTDFTYFLEENIYNGPVYLEDITLDNLQEFMNYRKNVRGNSARTRNNIQICFRSFWSFATKNGFSTQNPAILLDKIHFNKKERRYLTESEGKRLLSAITSPTGYTACVTILHTGLRISELTNLRLQDVNFERETIFVAHGKGDKERTIPISDELKKALLHYFQMIRPQCNSDYFFALESTGRLSTQYLNQIISKAAKDAGLPHVSAHNLRHSFASILIHNDANLVCVQKLLGHNDIKTTSIYLHANQKDLKDTVNKLSL